MSRHEFGETNEHEARRKLVDDVVIALGLLRVARDYKEILEVMPTDSRIMFAKEANANSWHEAKDPEIAEAYLKTAIQPSSLGNAIEIKDGQISLTEAGQAHYTSIMDDYEADLDSRPYVVDMFVAAIKARAKDR